MKPKEGQTVIATESLKMQVITCGEEYKVLSCGTAGYYVKNPKSATGMSFVLYSKNWPIKQEKRDCKRICGVVALVLMVIGVLLYRLLK